MRILAIDHGSKRMGIAVSDELKMIAQPLEYILAEPSDKFLARLNELINDKEVELILIGMPGIENSLRLTRPSGFKPTSTMAKSFSMATTVPLITLPSCGDCVMKLSSSMVTKSSRVGLEMDWS